ncbi:hypothetical protein D2E25_0305 [Bifidobacterium goeldii]|uniref:Uncharacterized protein n=1 Tax=Bifidobacterium goeldii TaxID=2306975 RepID=A0A430FM69_9BIFI|nr:hypothetical protein D2E25_0305 [Bifidobacterium goeldii]
MACRKALRCERGFRLPRCRLRWWYIFDGELQWTHELRPCSVKTTYLSGDHIVKRAATRAIAWQARTEHWRTHATTMTIAIYRCFPRWLLHASTVSQGDASVVMR